MAVVHIRKDHYQHCHSIWPVFSYVAKQAVIDRMSAAELNAMLGAKQKGKQRAGGDNAQRVEYMGEMFDSKHEAMRWRDLNLMQRAGIITDLKRQV